MISFLKVLIAYGIFIVIAVIIAFFIDKHEEVVDE